MTTTNDENLEPIDIINSYINLPNFNWCDYPLSPINVNEYNEPPIIDLTNTTDDDDEIDFNKDIHESGELWCPTVKKVKKNKKNVKNKKKQKKKKKKK